MWTGDERVFFYNPTTRLSMWERPEELVGRVDVDKAIQEPPHKRGLDNSHKMGKRNACVHISPIKCLHFFMTDYSCIYWETSRENKNNTVSKPYLKSIRTNLVI